MERTVIHQSLVRPQLIMGCDRELYFALVALALVLGGPSGIMEMNYTNVAYAAAVWFIGQNILLRMAKKDPYMRQVFNRSMRYRRFYPACGRIWEDLPEYKRW